VAVVPRRDRATGRDATRIEEDAIIVAHAPGGGGGGSAGGAGGAGAGESIFEMSARRAAGKQAALPTSPLASPGKELGEKTNVLDFFFPRGSPQRAFLEGLVHRAPPGSAAPPPEGAEQALAPRRWTAAEALAWLDAKWPADVA
jgi:hypothetical protein